MQQSQSQSRSSSSSPLEVSSLGFYGFHVSSSSPVFLLPAPDRVLRISSAALPPNAPEKSRVTLLVTDPNSKSEYALATLTHQTPHTSLDLFFVSNQKVAFRTVGNCELHVTGYSTIHETYEGEDEDEDEFDDEDDGDFDGGDGEGEEDENSLEEEEFDDEEIQSSDRTEESE